MTAAPSTEAAVSLDGDRLLLDLRTLAGFGRLSGSSGSGAGGLDRPAFSPAYRAAQDWLAAEMTAAGLRVRLDGAGNLIGRIGPEDAPAVICGSHIDTVPGGGWLDGALGVIAGLEAARTIAPCAETLTRAVEVVAFADEEGAYLSLLGARAMTGALARRDIETAVGRDGEALTTAMARFGLTPESALAAARAPAEIAAFLELHIEQGPVLEAEGVAIGIVEGIVGLLAGRIRFRGAANHAGTTPFALRRDAFRAAAEAMTSAYREVEAEFPADARLTFGAVEVAPGASNVVPSAATLTFEIRALDEACVDAIRARLGAIVGAAAAACRVEAEIVDLSRDPSGRMTPALVERVARAAGALDQPARRMPSGAGHDAQAFAGFCPTAMIFTPSIGGVSHNPAEDTREADLVAGAAVLARAARDLAMDPSPALL